MTLKKLATTLCCFSTLALFYLWGSIPAEAITRGIMAEAIVDALAIPRWTGEERFSDVPENHPAFSAIETARSYGIIYPGERFHPDLEATRIEALYFAFKAMGWSHEASLMGKLNFEENNEIPEYMVSYLSLGKTCVPSAPQKFLTEPKGNLTDDDLKSLVDWLLQCRQSIVWDEIFHGKYTSLRIHREKIGTPPRSWAIFVKEAPDKNSALLLQEKISLQGLPAFIANTECAFAVFVGPYSNYVKAWETLSAMPSEFVGNVVPYSEQGSNALFWAAICSIDGYYPSIITAPSQGRSLASLSNIAKKAKAEGGINGGFFASKKPIGTLLIDGEPVSPSYTSRSAIGWSDKGEAFFGNGEFRIVLRKENWIAPVPLLNTMPPQNSLALFSSEAGPLARPLPQDSQAFLLTNGHVSELNGISKAKRIVPSGSLLLAARGTGIQVVRSLLEKGNPLSVEVEWRDPVMQKSKFALQGGPMLLKDGELQSKNEGFSVNLRNQKHPRTLVGSNGKKLWWVVIDGRDPWHSNGVTLMEAARLADNLGISTLLNLDGGGSSELIWKDYIINSIPGGKERPLPYGIFFGSEEGE
ncbi:MAG: phosphodiester glycosidase family protein [Aminobacterium sp.]|jgi:hypothetical protein|nr:MULTISPECIES: phosphodiester glycosidase family protein [unclassified Aminobacterium]MDD2207487.1 phosphodiester glycosidase family protein [Aminobacterium sp.]MDD3426789.1 phosphodiester glycosidase family protein [Aminobacterium sp.]MDD3708117.1 phosphodiester glycosidase family protein [Aminobacterium sp.]MDD4228736.1 phosphodiester glycosidase family protein [Aminobacterium sp.]MDD4551750.1 phosphodiester glycosidase family protein [Aminobacterium sp.]